MLVDAFSTERRDGSVRAFEVRPRRQGETYTTPMIESIDARLHEIATKAGTTLDEVLAFLDSPAGRRLRGMLATGLIVSVPLLMRVPGLRRSPLGRAIEVAGGATLVVKLAELVRDWERGQRPSVVDSQPA